MVRSLKAAAPTRRPVFRRRIERRVLDYIRGNEVLSAGDSVLVAVSGGPDSTALLTILAVLADRLDVRLTVAHFDHRLRGKGEAVTDLQYVSEMATSLGLQLVTGSGDVRAAARRRRQSIEDGARSMRYAFLAREAKTAGAAAVVTGHTMDDQAETVLLHISRGSGIDGLAGMRPRSDWPFGRGPALARPLLCLTREDIERYCLETGLNPRLDETNTLLGATRNRIRLRVLPELKAVNPAIVEALARLATSAAADADYLDAAARSALELVNSGDSQIARLNREALRDLPPAIASRVVRMAVERVTGSVRGLEAIHVESILTLSDPPPRTLNLPGGLTAFNRGSRIHITTAAPAVDQKITETPLQVPGDTTADGWIIRCAVVPLPPTLEPGTPLEAYLNHRLAKAHLLVRSRRPGDRLRPLGMNQEKKLQDLFVDAKVPAYQRDSVPLIADDVGILWVVGHRIASRAAVQAGDKKVLHIRAERVG
jgi:tRNA(Ile)-lysidine synthase